MLDAEAIQDLKNKIKALEKRVTELELLNFHSEWNNQMKIQLLKDK